MQHDDNSLHIAAETLDLFSKLILQARLRGGFLTKDDWSDRLIKGKPMLPQTASNEAITRLQYLNQLKSALEGLVTFTEAAVEAVETTIKDLSEQPHSHGDITSKLPDELLSQVFIDVHEVSAGDIDTPSYVPLGLVCRRFRNISLKTPKLWNTFRCTTEWGPFARSGPRQRKMLLERSGSIGLKIEIVHDTSGRVHSSNIASFLDDLLDHAFRWEELYISILKFFDEETFNTMATITRRIRNRDLVNLKVFDVRFPHEDDLDASDSRAQQLCAEFQHTFQAPNLLELQVENFVPDLTLGAWSNLASLDITLGTADPDDGYFVHGFKLSELISALRETKKLEDLTLTISNAQFEVSPMDRVHLQYLRTLRLTITGCSSLSIEGVVALLHVPSLEEYTVCAYFASNSDLEVEQPISILCFLSPREGYKQLTKLNVQLFDSNNRHQRIILKIFEQLKHLQHLYLSGNAIIPFDNIARISNFPRLQSITLDQCPHVHFPFFEELAGRIHGSGGKLREVNIHGCSQFPEGDFKYDN